MASLNTKFFFQPTGFFLLALIHCTVLISANSVVRNRVKRDTAAATGGDWWRQQKADGTMEKFELRNADTSTMVKGKNNLTHTINQIVILFIKKLLYKF